MTTCSPLLQIEDLYFGYADTPIVSGWSLRLPAGLHTLVDQESRGKTTLLRLLAGELPALSGQIFFGDRAVTPQTQAYRKALFWLDARSPAAAALDPLTPRQWWAAQQTKYPLWSKDAMQAHIDGWALGEHLDKPMATLSAGSRRKVLMAAALASGAAITLLDEPLSGLDKASIVYLQQALTAAADANNQPGGSARMLLVAHHEVLPGMPWQQCLMWDDWFGLSKT